MCCLTWTNLCPHLEVSGAEEILSPPQRDHSSSYTLHRYGCVLAICYTDTTRTNLFGPLVLIQQVFTFYFPPNLHLCCQVCWLSAPGFTAGSWDSHEKQKYLFMLMDMNCDIFLRRHKFVSNVYKSEVYFMSAAHILSSLRKLRTWWDEMQTKNLLSFREKRLKTENGEGPSLTV